MAANIGIFGTEQEALDGLVERLVAAHSPRSVWLFGSRARGDSEPDSDYDLLVVVDDAKLAKDPYSIKKPVLGLGVACDVFPCSTSGFDDAAEMVGTLCNIVKHEGRRLYAR